MCYLPEALQGIWWYLTDTWVLTACAGCCDSPFRHGVIRGKCHHASEASQHHPSIPSGHCLARWHWLVVPVGSHLPAKWRGQVVGTSDSPGKGTCGHTSQSWSGLLANPTPLQEEGLGVACSQAAGGGVHPLNNLQRHLCLSFPNHITPGKGASVADSLHFVDEGDSGKGLES